MRVFKLPSRVFLVVAILALATSASANAAMPYAYQIFAFRPWFVYVAVTILFEAWFIGRHGLGDSWLKSMGLSVLANLISACTCIWGSGAFHG